MLCVRKLGFMRTQMQTLGQGAAQKHPLLVVQGKTENAPPGGKEFKNQTLIMLTHPG